MKVITRGFSEELFIPKVIKYVEVNTASKFNSLTSYSILKDNFDHHETIVKK